MDEDFEDAALFGTGYALYRHGQDRLAEGIYRAFRAALDEWDPGRITGGGPDLQRPAGEVVAPVQLDTYPIPAAWDDYIGQAELMEELRLRVASAKVRHGPIPHMLISSTRSGMGRRAAVRLAVRQLGKNLIELCAPFTIDQLASAVDQLGYADVLFVDDLDRVSGSGTVGPGTLAALFQNGEVRHPDGAHFVDEISIVASTARLDAVPSSLVDRFPVRMAMADYSLGERARLVMRIAVAWRTDDVLDGDLAARLGLLCEGGGPAAAERLVLLVRDLAATLGRPPGIEEVVDAARRQLC